MSNSGNISQSNNGVYKQTAFCVTPRMWQTVFTSTLCLHR